MTRKHQPSSPCCCICRIDSANPEETITADTIRAKVHPQSPYPAWVQAEFRLDDDGDAFLLYIACSDDTPTDGLYAEVTCADDGTGTLKIYQVGGSQIGDTLALICVKPDVWHRLTLCYDSDGPTITATVDARDTRDWIAENQSTTADVPAAFTAGRLAGYSGTGSIRRYKYDRLWYYGTEPCAQILTLQEGDNTPASSSAHTWSLDNSPSATVQVYNPITGAYLGFFRWDQTSDDATDFSNAVNSYLSPIATPGETWTISTTINDDYYGTNVDQMISTATGDLANRLLVAANDGGYGWIRILNDPADFDQVGYTRGCIGPVNETQQLTTIGTDPYTLTFNGQTTSEITPPSTAADIQSALEALSTIGSGNISVTGTSPYEIEFIGILEQTDVSEITVNQPGCCHENDSDYYYDSCPRVTCHACGTCTLIDEHFNDLPDGPMPCGWDQDATDWSVSGGLAVGEGEICHLYDTNGRSTNVLAEFGVATLATVDDLTTITLSHGSDSVGITLTRVVSGPIPALGERFRVDFTPADLAEVNPTYLVNQPNRLVLEICHSVLCAKLYIGAVLLMSVSQTTSGNPTSGSFCVSTTQPTLSGHTTTYLSHLSATLSREHSPICPDCECDSDGCSYCEDGEWPAEIAAEGHGISGGPSGINKTWYLSWYYPLSCSVKTWGDDGWGSAITNVTYDFSLQFPVSWTGGLLVTGGYIPSDDSDASAKDSWPSLFRDLDGVAHPVAIGISLVTKSAANTALSPWAAQSNTSFVLILSVHRVVLSIGHLDTNYRWTDLVAYYVAEFTGLVDCMNLSSVRLTFVQQKLQPAGDLDPDSWFSASSYFEATSL